MLHDALAWLARRRRCLQRGSEPPIPPRPLIDRVGGGDYRVVGEEFTRHFVEFGGLEPSHRVLDIGCGCGRMAAPLTRFLRDGSYHGFDVDDRAVRWCRAEITPRFPAFRFQTVSLRNDVYRPDGAQDAASFRFPYRDRVFDFVFATSVFTHMLRPARDRYLSECARVLAPGGVLFASFFLLHDANRERVLSGDTGIPFPAEIEDGARVQHADKPEAAIAFPESEVIARVERAGFRLVRPVGRGRWSAGPGPSFQDLVVARRAGGSDGRAPKA